jgi:dephospho-CoA kinase
MAAQLSDKEFRDNCDVVIDNGGSIESMRLQVSAALSTINSKSAARGIL